MNDEHVSRNIMIYKVLSAFKESIFIGPILILSLQRLGKMTISEIYIMEAIVMMGLVLLEIPSGALADLIGRRKTIILGCFFHFLSAIMFSIMSSPLHVWIGNIFWVIGASLCSGADSAFLYDSLKEVGREGEYKKIEGVAIGNKFLLATLGCLLTGFISKLGGLRLPLLLNILGILISFIAAIFLRETPFKEVYKLKKQIDLMKISILFTANHKKIKWVIGFAVLIAVSSKIWFFTYNPYFEEVNLDLIFYGVIFSILNLISWFFSRYGYVIEKRIGKKLSIIILVLFIGLPIFLMGLIVSEYSVLFIILGSSVRGFMNPFIRGFMNEYLDSKNRATVISIKSAIVGFVGFIGLGLTGFLLNILSLNLFLQLLGLFVLLVGLRKILKFKKMVAGDIAGGHFFY